MTTEGDEGTAGTAEPAWPRNLHVFVCTTVGRHHCGGLGSEAILQRLRDLVEWHDLRHVRTTRMGCNQQHHQGPIVLVYPDGVWYGNLRVQDVDAIVEEHLLGGRPVERLRVVPDGAWGSSALT
ncbi:MAG TPA: (2Fe-2S) ferredoxin domain-containing protein [Candidatus Dormibacteraeota bacterium]|nr:(2Fe-2S) ferredoxin domain-containing protein [Candidatus Dormibacteraeota bacterium]